VSISAVRILTSRHQGRPVAEHQVELALVAPPVAVEQHHLLLGDVARRHPLAVGAQRGCASPCPSAADLLRRQPPREVARWHARAPACGELRSGGPWTQPGQLMSRVAVWVVPPSIGPNPFEQSDESASGWKKTTSSCVTRPSVIVTPLLLIGPSPLVAVGS
jgi:hypothetical protein